jgi:hypothetical protein
MEINDLIKKILSSGTIKALVDMSDYDTSCKSIIKQIHPDKCSLPNANDAFLKFMELKNLFDGGFSFDDDAGKVTIKETVIKFEGNKDLIAKSVTNYNKLYNLAKSTKDGFIQYLPEKFTGDEIVLNANFLSLKDTILAEEHVRWIINRLFEFSAYIEKSGYVHGGLTLDSFVVNPINHSIKVISFYHMRPINSKLETISAKYRMLYPASVFDKKLAENKIDVELVKRTGCLILGDSSSIGVKLKKTVSDALIQFLLRTSLNSIDNFYEYKKLLKDNYESKFYDLKL